MKIGKNLLLICLLSFSILRDIKGTEPTCEDYKVGYFVFLGTTLALVICGTIEHVCNFVRHRHHRRRMNQQSIAGQVNTNPEGIAVSSNVTPPPPPPTTDRV